MISLNKDFELEAKASEFQLFTKTTQVYLDWDDVRLMLEFAINAKLKGQRIEVESAGNHQVSETEDKVMIELVCSDKPTQGRVNEH